MFKVKELMPYISKIINIISCYDERYLTCAVNNKCADKEFLEYYVTDITLSKDVHNDYIILEVDDKELYRNRLISQQIEIQEKIDKI